MGEGNHLVVNCVPLGFNVEILVTTMALSGLHLRHPHLHQSSPSASGNWLLNITPRHLLSSLALVLNSWSAQVLKTLSKSISVCLFLFCSRRRGTQSVLGKTIFFVVVV